jgi:hypothetical protein
LPYFSRRVPPPDLKGSYRSFRAHVREDFEYRCAYCLLFELLAGGEENFELDHFRPTRLFPQEENSFYNIYYSCHPCNQIKRDAWPPKSLEAGGIGFVDLCKDDFAEHFSTTEEGQWHGITKSGQYTIDMLRLNRKHLVTLRRLLAQLRLAIHEKKMAANEIRNLLGETSFGGR